MREPPADLLQEILETFTVPLGFQTDSLPDRATLLSCSLVCRRWAMESQRLLFRRAVVADKRSIRFQSINAATSFRSVITANTPKSRWLRDSVVSIILRPDFRIEGSHTFTILMNLPNLRELNLEGGECIFTENELFQLRNTGPRIRSLRVHADPGGSLSLTTAMGQPVWPGVIQLIAALPTLRMVDITVDSLQRFPATPELIQPLGLRLVAFKFSSKWASDVGSFLSSLIGGYHDNEPLELYTHTGYTMLPDLRDVLSAHGSHLRSLVVKGSIKDVNVLGLCMRLERFECQCLPPDALVAAIPRTIRALAVTNPNTRQYSFNSLAYLTQQLDTFPALRIFTWVGSTEHSGFSALRDCCAKLNPKVEVRIRKIDNLSDDDVEYELRRRLLQI